MSVTETTVMFPAAEVISMFPSFVATDVKEILSASLTVRLLAPLMAAVRFAISVVMLSSAPP